MAKKILTTPIQKSDLEGIKPGDVIYLTGHITTARDMGHRLSLIHISEPTRPY